MGAGRRRNFLAPFFPIFSPFLVISLPYIFLPRLYGRYTNNYGCYLVSPPQRIRYPPPLPEVLVVHILSILWRRKGVFFLVVGVGFTPYPFLSGLTWKSIFVCASSLRPLHTIRLALYLIFPCFYFLLPGGLLSIRLLLGERKYQITLTKL